MAVNNGVEEISGRQFNETISKNLVVIDFFAEWCMPCLILAPVLEEMKDKFKDKIEFAKVNVDDNKDLAAKFSIMSIPVLIVFKEGKEIGRIIGSISPEVLEEKLKKLV